MKKLIVVFLIILTLTGCKTNEKDIKKEEYLQIKKELIENKEFSSLEDLDFDLNISIDRITEDEISYRAIIDNPKTNMYNVKAIIIHDNENNEEIFPSIGILDEPIDLIIANEEIKGISLIGYIKTNKDIETIDLNIKVYVEYINEQNETIKIYYKTTN